MLLKTHGGLHDLTFTLQPKCTLDSCAYLSWVSRRASSAVRMSPGRSGSLGPDRLQGACQESGANISCRKRYALGSSSSSILFHWKITVR